MNRDPSVQRQILHTRRWLQAHRWLRLHVGLIALCCLACLWMSGALLRHAGVATLSLRFGLSLAISYGAYLLLLRLWAAYLLSREDGDASDVLDIAVDAADAADWGGGLGDAAGTALDVASGADEGALVLLPIAAVIGMALLLATVLGAGVSLLFGAEVLMAVSVEVALAAFAAGLAWRHQRQFERGGWLRCALQHTWAGALAFLVAGVALGTAIDHWVPQAESLPHAVRIWKSAPPH